MQRQLYRSRANRVLAGVCGGIGEYFGIDPAIIRIIWVLVSLPTFGTGLVVYIVAAVVIPEAEGGTFNEEVYRQPSDPKKASLIIGTVFIVVGMLVLARRFLRWVDSGILWSFLLIILGLLVIIYGRRK